MLRRYWEIARKMIQSICCALKSTFISPESQPPGMLEVQPAPLSRNNSSNKMELLISSVREERCCNMLNHVYSHNYIFSMCTPVLWFHIQKCSTSKDSQVKRMLAIQTKACIKKKERYMDQGVWCSFKQLCYCGRTVGLRKQDQRSKNNTVESSSCGWFWLIMPFFFCLRFLSVPIVSATSILVELPTFCGHVIGVVI